MRRLAPATTATTVVAMLMGGLGAAVAAPTGQPGSGDDHRPRHSSDDQPGVLAPRRVADAPFGGGPVVKGEETVREVAPGLVLRQWEQSDPRGDALDCGEERPTCPMQVSLLTVDLGRPDLHLGYAAPRKVADSGPLTELIAAQDAVAGINGDFFDINDTMAPLGVGVDDGRLRHGPRRGWTTSFVILEDGRAAIRRTPVRARILRRPGIKLTNLNSPQVPIDGIGVFTRAWGSRPGYSVVEGAPRKNLREVVVRRGKVVRNARRLTDDKRIRGPVLIGRGEGARALRELRRGSRVRLTYAAKGDPALAISGSEKLLGGGEVRATDDVYLHPRTAVGIDRDAGQVLMMVVDGRTEQFPRGATLVELAMLLQEAGADLALNLDGGGSSTMVAQDEFGEPAVVNAPSDGRERAVPNGLAVTTG